MDGEATVATIATQKISWKSTNLDIRLQSSSGVVGDLTGLMHHFHLLHHEVHLEKSFPGGTRRMVRSLVCRKEG